MLRVRGDGAVLPPRQFSMDPTAMLSAIVGGSAEWNVVRHPFEFDATKDDSPVCRPVGRILYVFVFHQATLTTNESLSPPLE